MSLSSRQPSIRSGRLHRVGGPSKDAKRESALASTLIAALGERKTSAADAILARKDLSAVIEDVVARATSAWPKIKIDVPMFVEHVGKRLAEAEDPSAALDELHASDLLLAYACGVGHRSAIAELDHQLDTVVAAALARMKDKVSSDDVGQLLREKLLVGTKSSPPKILEYSGRGPLGGWIRIAAVRTALSLGRRGDGAAMQPVTREVLLKLPSESADPEMTHLRKRYARDFKRAFEDALAELSPEDRNLLRLSLVDGLSIDEIGLVFGVHRATAARHLARCREDVQRRTREILGERLSVGAAELKSIMGYIQSDLDLSIQRLLSAEEVSEIAKASPKTRAPASAGATSARLKKVKKKSGAAKAKRRS